MTLTSELRPYKVVLLARAAAVFREDQGFKLDIRGEETSVDLRVRTRFDEMPVGLPVPREIWFEANVLADSIDHAVDEGRQAASWIVPVLAFVANAEVGDPSPHLAFDASEESTRREFLQFHLPEDKTPPGRGRIIDNQHLRSLVDAVEQEPEPARMWRALAQYSLALRYWFQGGEFLALSHLWMAVEALLPLIVEDVCNEQSKTLEELATERNLDLTRPWKNALLGAIRRERIFQGDEVTHRLAKAASDGLEHGFEEAPNVQRNAVEVCDKVFEYMRAAIVRRLRFEKPVADAMRSKEPIDTRSSRKLVHAFLCGDISRDQLASPEEPYPRFTWTTSIKEVVGQDDCFSITLNETLTGRFGDGVSLEEAQFRAEWRPTSQELSAAVEPHSAAESPAAES